MTADGSSNEIHPDLTVKVFPGADHRIGFGEPPRFAPGHLDTITDWTTAR